MGSGEDDEREPCFSTLEFSILPRPPAIMLSPEHPSGMATPPLQTSASVPFKWEEQPGKPRPCTDILLRPEPAKCLELPPCRMPFTEPASKITKMPSPTTVLDGPCNVGRSKFSSFRLFREAQASFDSSSSSGSPQNSLDILLSKKKKGGFFRKSLRPKSGKEEADGGSCGFSPSSTAGCKSFERCSSVKMEGKMRRNGSFSSLSEAASTPLWVTMRECLRKAVPWSSTRKSKNEGGRLQEFDIYK